MENRTVQNSASFLIDDVSPQEVFTPEDFTDEHRMIAKTTQDFIRKEVQPHVEALEHQDFDLTRKLFGKAADIGLLSAGIEEQYGGTGTDEIAALIISTYLAGGGAFTLSLGCHLGIGRLPLAYFGNTHQKEKYLPGLTNGEKIGAYALTEPLSGSDALSLRSSAVLSADGTHYVLNGEKQFITNGGFADIIFTYARIDNKVTAFIIEKDFEGVSTGREEKKMGIKGSSTVSAAFQDAKVPTENVLFEIGKGHMVALNILNMGRLKLAGACVESAKFALEHAVTYAKSREQFGTAICQFGLIKHKVAEMATRIYIAESIFWRTGGSISDALSLVDHSAEDLPQQNARQLAEYALECAINKVFCSEMLDYVTDEALQIHGGYGYIEEYHVERFYRDSRINRLFEGTNEINRLTILDRVIRKTLKGELPLMDTAKKLSGDLLDIEAVFPSLDDSPLGYQGRLVKTAKKAFVLTAGAAAQKHGPSLAEQQEILGYLADMVIEIYTMESGLLRGLKAIEVVGAEEAQTKIQMTSVYVNDTMRRIEHMASCVLTTLESGDLLHIQLAALRKLTNVVPVDTIQIRRKIADRIIEANGFAC